MNSKQLVLSLNGLWNKLHRRPLVWDTITTTSWSTLGKAVGFLVPFFIAAWFGITSETDAFFFAYGLILFLSGIFAPVVESVIVPYIADERAKNEDVGAFVGRILCVSGVYLLIFTGIILLFIKPILSVITRFDSQTLNLVYYLLIETAPLIILLVGNSIIAGALNAYKKFIFPAISPAFRAIVNLSIIFIFKDIFGVHAIALGYMVGEIVRLAFLLAVIQRVRLFKLHISFQLNPKLREFLKTASYQIIGMVLVGLSLIVDKTMASWLGIGNVSVLHYASILYMIPITFMTTGIMVTILSHWSGRYYEESPKKLKEDVKKTVKVVGFITLLIMIGLILIHKPIVQLAFGRGTFTRVRLHEIGWVWVCYLFGIIPYIIKAIFVRAHLILKNTKVLMQCALYMNILNMLFNYILMKVFMIAGIALATTLINVLSLFYLSNAFYRKLEKKRNKN